MKIEQYWERNGIRLKATIENIDLPSHSKMQSLRAPLIEAIKADLEDVLISTINDIEQSLNNAPADKLGR